MPTLTPFPAAAVDSFEAGPDGITCAVLSATQEVVCHTRTINAFRPVCP